MSEYPWTTLGIKPSDDERAIRKAYAAKLRVTRPDEDPIGFQALVEARDIALSLRESAERRETDSSPLVEAQLDVTLVVDPQQQHDELPETLRLLNALPRSEYPEHIAERWTPVLDALERAPLNEAAVTKRVVLMRLVYALAEDLGPMPDFETLPKTALLNPGLLGPYAEVLRDIERRFRFLDHDMILLEYLDWEQARYFRAGLEIAVGEQSGARRRSRPFREVRAADHIWARIAFRTDPEMLRHQEIDVATDTYHNSFSPLGILFPLPVALYYRLYGFAFFVGTTIAWFALGRITSTYGDVEHYLLSFFLVPPLLYLGAYRIRSMRIAALGRKVASLSKTGDLPTIAVGVEAWAKPNLIGMSIGIALVAIVILSIVLI